MLEVENLLPKQIRAACRKGSFSGPTSGLAKGYVQANMVILPSDYAKEFSVFCEKNPQPCPVLEVLEPGNPEVKKIAPNSDVRTDLPRYRIFRNGLTEKDVSNITELWSADLVTFLLGCSFVAEDALIKEGFLLPHIKESGFVPMYKTSLTCNSAGRFRGEMVVSMRPFTLKEVEKVTEITKNYPMAHGAPVHVGDPSNIGIKDIHHPEFGRPVTMQNEQVPVFWACGVTPQEAIANAGPPIAITHAPGHMFIADITAESTRINSSH